MEKTSAPTLDIGEGSKCYEEDAEPSDKANSPTHGKKEKTKTTNQSEPSLLSSLKKVVVIVGVTLIFFAAFRNSLTWHLQKFWGASGDFWQAQWDKILHVFGDDPYTYEVYGLLIYSIAIYWIIGSIFTVFDITNKPAVLRKYKVQPGTNEPLDLKKLPNVIICVLINQTIVTFTFGQVWYQASHWRGVAPLRELPTFHWVLVELAAFIVIEEILFYYCHRLLHNRHIYRHIHKKHHEWTSPIAVTAIYCHPIEHVLSNTFPVLFGPLVMRSHVATMYLWLTIATLNTIITHSGYHLPFLMSPEDHDFHHQKFNYCFGVLGVLDRLHGTDAAFRKSAAYRRHTILLSLKPAREIYPDKKNILNKKLP